MAKSPAVGTGRLGRLLFAGSVIAMLALPANLATGGTAAAAKSRAAVHTATTSSPWSEVTVPTKSGKTPNQITGVSCISTSSCEEVGYWLSTATGKKVTLAEHWNGSHWALQSTPAPSWLSELRGISCVSSTFCMAVGDENPASGTRYEQSLAMQWTGTKWSAVSTPNPGGYVDTLESVSCTSATSCSAVGYQEATSGSNADALVESWNGQKWTTATAANPSDSADFLLGVSCVSTKFCAAVGWDESPSSVTQTLVETWNGSKWTAASSPDAGTSTNMLVSVACTSSSACVAVGYAYVSGVMSTLTETWQGSSWQLASSPNSGSAGSAFEAVSCPTTACTAVGYFKTSSGLQQTLAEAWNGTSWAIDTTPNSGKGNNQLFGVSCASSAVCVSAGDAAPTEGFGQQVLAEYFSGGKWTIQKAADHSVVQDSLAGVSCTSSTFCMAVGQYTSDNLQSPLAEMWNGTKWTVTKTPSTPSAWNAVSCTSSTFCIAVGGYPSIAPPSNRPVIERWTGTAWTSVSGQSLYGLDLSSVSCASTAFCKAAGLFVNGNDVYSNAIESWNGSSFSADTVPEVGPYTTEELSGVSCKSASDCIAVGQFYDSSDVGQTLAERWDGTSWTIDSTSQDQGAGNNSLAGVACAATRSCVAVGYFVNAQRLYSTLAEAWNGTTWGLGSSPNDGTSGSSLAGIACPGSTACLAVGFYYATSSVSHTYTAGWNGTKWTATASPNLGSDSNQLTAVACTSATACMSVGSAHTATSIVPIAQRYA